LPVDNSIYNINATGWWDEKHFLHTLKTGINPVRFKFFQNILQQQSMDPKTLKVLDIGCGGGILSEDFARLGCTVNGIDLSTATIKNAREHAQIDHLEISYHTSSALALAFPSEYFDIVLCCDVLEHLPDLDIAIEEASRVLKPAGIYLFDTINRTIPSYFETILIAQELPITRFFPPGTHAWRQFIPPPQLTAVLKAHKLNLCQITGIQPGISIFQTAVEILRLKFRQITFAEFGRRLKFKQTESLRGSYMGHAIKS
jgi:2-polyprenyl-6-hydroxyphenyl methylase/3-demethylubiquinone-9 3-methyltransferase